MSIDRSLFADGHDDHRLVHHFIRTNGRRPQPAELRALRRTATAPRHRQPGEPITLLHALRRDVARLLQRF